MRRALGVLFLAALLVPLVAFTENPVRAEGDDCWEPASQHDTEPVMGPQGFMTWGEPTMYRAFHQQRVRYINTCHPWHDDEVRYMYWPLPWANGNPNPQPWYFIPGCVFHECVCGTSFEC